MTATDSYIVPVKVQSRLREGQIVKMSDLLKEVAKPAAPDEVKITPVPLPTAITPDEKAALERLMDVYGSVVPSERRRLEPAEVSKALVERGVLKTVEAMVGRRISDLNHIVLNHSDVEVDEGETDGLLTAPDGTPFRNKDGHYIRKAKLPGDDPEITTQFSLETRNGSATLSAAALKEIADDPEKPWFTHEDYLAFTRQERVFDENKAMLVLRTRPELLRAIQEATTTSQPSVAVYERKI